MPKVFLDPGHGGYDPGALGFGLEEKDITLNVAKKIAPILERHNVTVKLSRTTDVYIGLTERTNLANGWYADYFVSIHCNAFNGMAYGVETYHLTGSTGAGRDLARNIQNAIVSAGLARSDRGVKSANYTVLKYSNMPAALVEMAFIDNSGDNNLLKTKQDEFAVAIAKGILKQLGIPYKEDNTPPAPNPDPPSTTVDNPNAVIVNDWLYTRDPFGNIVSGRVDIGDKVQVLDVFYSSQLVLMKYPTLDGVKTAYTTNAVNCISYYYQDQWANGSTPESVYEDAALTRQIGTIYPYEKATPLYRKDGMLHIIYDTDNGPNTKSGFVEYNGGFNKF